MLEPATQILLYAVIPLWLLAGVADWWCHRTSRIETSSGLKESVIHVLMFSQGAVALLAGLFLEMNALVFALFITLLLLHELTAIWDLRYAVSKRVVTTMEQHVHSFLEVIPFLAFVLLSTLHWEQFSALFSDWAHADFVLRWKAQTLSSYYIGSILLVAVCVDFAVYAEELRRCYLAQHKF